MEVNVLLRMKQIAVGNYSKRDGTASFFLYGLDYNGDVYRHDDRRGGWIKMSMDVAEDIRSVMSEEDDN